MRPLDRALAGRAFSIDAIACAAGAQVIRGFRMKPLVERFTRPPEPELLFRVVLSAICHQINWDFLADRLGAVFDAGAFDAGNLALINARDVEAWLTGYHRPERIRAKERAALLRDVGGTLVAHFEGKASKLLAGSGSRLYGPGGFLSRLDEFHAFAEDPLRKKSNVLVHEIVRDGLASFADADKIAPAIDYHIMRLYLRSGRVVPLHHETVAILKRDSVPRPRLVKLLREAVSEAVALTALYASMSIPEVNTIEWQLGREICDRARPACNAGNASISEQFGISTDKCPYAGFCLAFSNPEWRLLREPDLKKSFY